MFTIVYPPDLPISARREEIVATLRAHQVVVVAGETGSGKTTQLPKMCLEAGLAERGRIGCTQPRRVAALSISRRVAEELRVPWGREVGCKMRFNDDTSRETRLKFMTDGILLAEIQSDPLLRGYTALILDEAHERSLNIDFLLGYLQGLLRRRGDLKLIITSATIDTEAFSRAFGGAPVIEVSGRLWPVEIRYAPIEDAPEDDLSFPEAAARAAEDAFIESDSGDVLIFMPTERDIRETRDLLEERLGAGYEVLGLFGRLPAGEQERIFAPGLARRAIVATNIAETSLTLPRIRYVIDAGLARVSRYNPRTRTRRLPVEPVSQSSAQQRAGRAGRLAEGICVRLYSQEDLEKRPRFTQPEIQRANLAEVILRMKAFRLGEIETFPFLHPPPSAAIRAGYALLHELGALSEMEELTPLGAQLARLPVDPTLGRMLLQAREEGVLPEMLVIAAGLSVPDPRERPEEKREEAAAAHRLFFDPDSDFISLLAIWRAAPPLQGKPSTNALRRFCKAHFISLSRLREWRDLYRQLAEAVPVASQKPAAPAKEGQEDNYVPIHRCILSGLLGHVALREERNAYRASGNRQVTVFPGSNLYERPEKKRRPADAAARKPAQPPWIVAGEIVETSQLFARSVAGINPEWIVELGAHLCQHRYVEPHWSAKAGRVLVLRRILLHGLEVARDFVDYGRVDAEKATELFIRGALLGEEIKAPLRFLSENRLVREKIENALTRVRSRRALDLDESFFRFYAARLEGVSSVHDLNRVVRERIGREPDFLCATEADLIGEDDATYDRQLFPDAVKLGPTVLPLTYAYTPGEERDGVTLRVPLPVAEQLTTGQIQWLVPGLREEQIGVLLRALPKAVRKPLMPLEPKIAEIARSFDPGRGDFMAALAAHLSRVYRVPVRPEDWPAQSLPAHLQTRVEVVNRQNQTVAAGRDLSALHAEVRGRDLRTEAWDRVCHSWEKTGVTAANFADLPAEVEVERVGGVPLLAHPGLELRDGAVAVRLFRRPEEVEAAAPAAIRRLAEEALTREIAHLRKDLGPLSRPVAPAGKSQGGFQAALQQLSAPARTAAAATWEDLPAHACEHLLRHALVLHPILPLSRARFEALLQSAHSALPKLAYELSQTVRGLLAMRAQLLALPSSYPALPADVARLLPSDFLLQTPHRQLPHLARYLRAIAIRAERARVNPGKDTEKASQLLPYADWPKRVAAPQREAFRWLLEEFRVSLFAQELGTPQPVSPKRLAELMT